MAFLTLLQWQYSVASRSNSLNLNNTPRYNERSIMGNFERHVFKTLHDININDSKGEFIAVISINQSIERVESWDHLKEEHGSESPKAAPQAGPHNRRILDILGDISVHARAVHEKHLPAQIEKVVSELKKDKGLKVGAKIISFTSADFQVRFTKKMKAEFNYVVTFMENSL